jgi:crotonobetainyl-CoA:carnitine CoA-transferase CaiB-like acyl-CoA transferase
MRRISAMASALSGLRVLDLSWGISGPMATMLLADHGADVIKIEPPGGDPFRRQGCSQLGYKTWQRGKRSAILDLKDPADLAVFKTLATHADVLVESFEPGVTQRLGVDYETLSALNPRLIYATVTAYGSQSAHADRPGYDLLVAARTGLTFEHRGWPEGCVGHMAGRGELFPDLEIPYDWVQGPPREGPITTSAPAPSIGAFYWLTTAINAAILARETTGRGQRVETSLLQGALGAANCSWQAAENPDIEGYGHWIKCSKSPKGHFECKDGRWIHQWVPNPRFILGASEGDEIVQNPDLSVQNDPNRFGTGMEEIVVIAHYQPILAERVKKFGCDDWLAAGAAADVPLQECRSPEAALSDPIMLADGCVREVEDPELGAIRQVGVVLELEKTPCALGGPAPAAGQQTQEVRAEAAALASRAAPQAAPPKGPLANALSGVRVLDLGLAVAGPFGCQVLADLGADVIKINAFHDSYWHKNHISFAANRGKRSVCLDLKTPEGMGILRELVKTADVVQHNMRYDAATRLGVDYETLKAIKPDLIYCHTRGHERGPRERLPGNDQTGACLAGVQYEDGGIADGGKPLWSLTSFGDTGCGFLSAIGIIEALYHRARTGEGQFVGTAIAYAQLLNTSHALARPDGSGFDRPRLDAMATGMSALNSLYDTADGWIAVVAPTDAHWAALKRVLGVAALDAADFATAEARRANDKALRSALAQAFKARPAAAWREALDAAGVPVEVNDKSFALGLHHDPEMIARGLTATYHHELVGQFSHAGLMFNLSETPGKVQGPPLVVGERTAEVLKELGYSDARIAELAAAKVAGVWKPGEPLISGPRRFIGYKPQPEQAAPKAEPPQATAAE